MWYFCFWVIQCVYGRFWVLIWVEWSRKYRVTIIAWNVTTLFSIPRVFWASNERRALVIVLFSKTVPQNTCKRPIWWSAPLIRRDRLLTWRENFTFHGSHLTSRQKSQKSCRDRVFYQRKYFGNQDGSVERKFPITWNRYNSVGKHFTRIISLMISS